MLTYWWYLISLVWLPSIQLIGIIDGTPTHTIHFKSVVFYYWYMFVLYGSVLVVLIDFFGFYSVVDDSSMIYCWIHCLLVLCNLIYLSAFKLLLCKLYTLVEVTIWLIEDWLIIYFYLLNYKVIIINLIEFEFYFYFLTKGLLSHYSS